MDEDSSYESLFVTSYLDAFSLARNLLSCEYVSVVFPKHFPKGFCLLVDDDAAFRGRKVSAIGTYLFGHYMEAVPLCGPFLVVKYDDADKKRRAFSLLSKEEAEVVLECFDEQVVPHIKDALKAMLKQKKRENFRVV